MFKNYIVSAYRNLLKSKVFAFVNIAGLATGFTACLFISLFVLHEFSYDTFFDDADDIYRVSLDRVYPDRERKFAPSPITLAPTLLNNYSEVIAATRLHRLYFTPEVPIRIEDETFMEDKFLFADSSFFDVFSFEFIEGNANTALHGPEKIVLTESTARKYFGNTPAVNKTVFWDTTSFIISGVIKDVPQNSHIAFDLIGSIHTIPYLVNAIQSQSWINPWVYTYIKLNPSVRAEEMQSKLPGMVEQYAAAGIAQRLGKDYAQMGHQFNFYLQSIRDIHLHSNGTNELQPNSDVSYLYILLAIGAFILLISGINYVNIATARSAERSKEVGVRKVLGSSRQTLIGQFLAESMIAALIASVLALGAFVILDTYFFDLVGQQLDLGLILHPIGLILLLAITIFIGCLAGIYPSLVISSIQSATVLKGSFKTSEKGVLLRNGLIGLQFFISVIMISGVLFVNEQMEFLSQRNLGFEKENVLTIRQAGAVGTSLSSLNDELEKIPGVISVGAANAAPGDFIGSTIFRSPNPNVSDLRANVTQWGNDYIETMEMNLVAGRSFGKEYNDSLAVIINEAAAESLGVDDPVGLQIRSTGGTQDGPLQTIVGIVEDYNFFSLHTPITPLVLNKSEFSNGSATIALRITDQNISHVRSEIENTWRTFVPESPANISFLSQDLEKMYQADKATAKVFGTFTIIAIILACIGLFGLASYTIQQRTKEIGIRKVLGATQIGLLGLLIKKFVKILMYSLVLSIPISYWAIGKWYDNFAYHVDINPIVFVKAGALTLVLIVVAISYQAISISSLNPTETLRTD